MKEKTNYIKALRFDSLTKIYDWLIKVWLREKQFKEVAIETMKLSKNDTVLDLACGTATLLIMIKQKFPDVQVYGIDGDENILKIAEQKTKQLDVDVKLEKGLSYALPYPNGMFDKIITSLFFHHLTDRQKLDTILEIKRVLKSDGILVVADWGKPKNTLMKLGSLIVQAFDGFEVTSTNMNGKLTKFFTDNGFANMFTIKCFNTILGTIYIYKFSKN
ncbi:MAG: class I SAM-dependent methyltransferase [Bacteroidetes bacterium]|nr:class I SAM-dependent methyltransferase [Bacteroidota bacterium]MBU1680688.1 class I SAM-dependent methyltransferase [Bacteroidota bacterium]MBU2507740.1 class I SAM-dependent methyltransferase [Bacteroidota bacterium]